MLLAGTIFGLLTLFAAVGAVLYARRAAVAAENDLSVSQSLAAAELRPWVAIDLMVTKFSADNHGIDIDYDIVLKNIGHTVASHFTFNADGQFLGERPVATINELFAKHKEPTKRDRFALMPSEERRYNGSHMTMKKLLPWFGRKPKRVHFIVIVTAHYWSPLDKQWHRTDRTFTVGRRGRSLFEDRYLFDDMMTEDTEAIVVLPYYAGETT